MVTFLRPPVKAGMIMFLVLTLVVSITLPKKALAVSPQKQLSFSERPLPFPEYPSLNPELFPCVNNIQYKEVTIESIQLDPETVLHLKIKVAYCQGRWSVEFAQWPSTSNNLLEVAEIDNGRGLAIKRDGEFSVSTSGVEIVKSREVNLDVAWSTDPYPRWVYQATYTQKANLALKGLQVATSVVLERGKGPEFKYDWAYNVSPEVGYGVAVAFGVAWLLADRVSTASGVLLLFTEDTLEYSLRHLKPSEIKAYEGFAPSFVPSTSTELKVNIEHRYGELVHYSSIAELTAPNQVSPGTTFSYSGSGFLPYGELIVSFGINPYSDLVTKVVTADSSGSIQGQITLPGAAQVVSGDYLLSVLDAASAQYAAQKLLDDLAANPKLYMAGAVIKVVGGTASSNASNSIVEPAAVTLTCSRVSQFDMKLAYLFSGTDCGGDLTWFSAHSSNGPSASGQSSLFVPSGSVVNVSSNDDNSGDRACFAETVYDLASVGWQNRIQWAQVVSGGTCQSSQQSSDGYIVHTNQGDFTVSAGQTWDNQQHNRQILGFDRVGTAHLIINHRGGASRCWNETKSASSLGDDGDWWLQTQSIVVGSGYCPGNDGELIVFVNNNFQSGEHSRVHAGTTHSYEDNNRKGSFRFTKPGMSAIFKAADGRTRCWNTDVTALGDHEDYGTRTVAITAYGTNVCPPPRAPEAPANLTASVNGSDQVTLNWTNDYGYNGGTIIWEKHPGQSAFVGNLSVGEGGTSFTYFVASCGQPVEYYVEAVDSDGRKAQSNHVFISTNSCSNLVAPTNFRATPVDYDSVRLDWDNNQSGVWEGYLVSYQKDDGSWIEIWPSGPNQNYYDINGLTPCSKTWTMAVASYQNVGRSPKSTPVTFTLPQCPHEIGITNFTATMQANNTANLSWDPHPHATGYTIEYSYNGSAFAPFSIGVTSSYNSFGGFSCGTAVRLRLSAQTPSGQTAASEVAFSANQCPTHAPENFTVSLQAAWANLSWTAHPYATSYIIEYSYNGAPFQPFQIGVTSSYNGWMGYPCGSTVTLRLSANTPYGRSQYSEVTFNGHVCASSLNNDTDQSMQIFLPVVSR